MFFGILGKPWIVKKIKAWIALSLCGLLAGCAGMELKQTVDQYRAAQRKGISQVKVVEHFNNKSGINQLGGKATLVPSVYDTVTKYHTNGGVPGEGAHLAFDISFDVNHPTVTWKTDLKNVDASQARVLALWLCVQDARVVDTLFISLRDMQGNVATVPLTTVWNRDTAEDAWQELLIPQESFAGIDWNVLKELSIVARAPEGSTTPVQFEVDAIMFVGSLDLDVASLKDNLYGFPSGVTLDTRRQQLGTLGDRALVEAIARDTWDYFDNTVDQKTHLPLDMIKVDAPLAIGAYTSPTNIGLYLICCVGARELGYITAEEANEKIEACLKTTEQLAQWHGFFFNYYHTTALVPTSSFVSTVDCGWFAAALIVVRQACNGAIRQQATKLLKAMNFGEFYDDNLGHLFLGYDVTKNEFSKYHYGLLASEARIASLVAMGKGDVPHDHWFRLYRSLPPDWDWQAQKPQGVERTYLGRTVFQGYYTYNGHKIVPSWGGSLFEMLMPTLVVDENEKSPRALAVNNQTATRIQIDYALHEAQFPVWGLSPCSVAGGRYGGYAEFGVPGMGVKGYRCEGVVTPHASFLALDTLPGEAVKNIRTLLKRYPIYGAYGLYDSVTLQGPKVSYRYLALDQAMTFISCVNYLKNNIIKSYFHRDSYIASVDYVMGLESFFETNQEQKSDNKTTT